MNFLTGDPTVDFIIGYFSIFILFAALFFWR